ITVDATGSGQGWFLDPAPNDNLEFGTALTSSASQASADSSVSGRFDLLTVLLHEVGHALAFSYAHPGFASQTVRHADGSFWFVSQDLAVPINGDHLDSSANPWDLMTDSVQPGVRELPTALDAEIVRLVQKREQKADLKSHDGVFSPPLAGF